ncbi:DUF349 domain-containing protein [Catenovulum sp. SX2]|uniref:DUF349 domain-containing protein n=1 Tax=Catenovulum sp. SX2 TaxID=3398614 RepID=UPI003F85BE88
MMIFKQLFQPKWQHKDAVVRLQAIQKLNDNSILEQVASKDIDTNVRKQALEQLNSLSCWDHAMQHDSDVKIQKLALEKVKQLLFSSDSVLSVSEKQQYLQDCQNTALLEDFVRRGDDDNLRLTLLNKLNKNNLNYDLAIRDGNESIALACAERIDDTKQLEKIAQKAKHLKVQQWASAKLDELKAAAEKPELVRKQTSLILSKLLALKDKSDYLQVKNDGSALVEQWQQLQGELVCLPEEEQQTLVDKYQQIESKYSNNLTALETVYTQAQAEKLAAERQQKIIEQVSNAIAKIQSQVALAIESNGDSELDAIVKSIADAKQLLSEDHIGGRETENLFRQLNQIEHNAAHLPEFAEQVAQATRALTQLHQWQLPETLDQVDQAQSQFNQWFEEWKTLKRQMLFALPESLQESSQSLIKSWKDSLKDFSHKQNSAIKQLKGQMRELDRLIQAGRYNVALGLFRKISEGVEGLTAHSYSKIEREHQRLNEQVNNLEEWKSYIGLPRKRELLAEIEAMAEQTLDDVHARAKQVKFARHNWRLLGNTDCDENKQLNQAFDLAIEQAFAPCREKFAELEAQRATNLQARNQLVEEVQACAEAFAANADYAELAKHLPRLQNDWNKAGSVERSEYNQVSQAFFAAIKPLRQKLNQFYTDNAEQKRQLIVKAQKYAQEQEVAQASEALKQLQQQWKNIGFAGAQVENKLWAEFRAINDGVFNQKQADYQAEKDKQQHAYESVKEQIDQLVLDLEKANLEQCYSQIDKLKAISLAECSPNQAKRLDKLLSQAISSYQQKIAQLKQQAQADNLQQWLTNLEAYVVEGQLDEAGLNSLPANIIHAIELAQNSQQSADISEQRRDITIRMEIVSGVETPAEDASRKMEIQVQLLSEKLNEGETQSTLDLLKKWLSLGAIQTQDKALFARVSKAMQAELQPA